MHDFYGLEPRHLGSYEFDRVKVLKGGFEPLLARDVLDDEGRRCLAEPYKYIVRSERELVEAGERDVPIKPHWDPVLKNNAVERVRLFIVFEI